MIQSIVWLDQLEAQHLYAKSGTTQNGDRDLSRDGQRPTLAAGFVVTAAAVKEVRAVGKFSETLQEEILRFYHQLMVADGIYKPFVHVSIAPVRQGVVEASKSDIVFGSESVLHRIEDLVVAEGNGSPFSVLVQSYQTPLQLRAYTVIDQDVCAAIFDSNTPSFFAPPEKQEFVDFLNDPRCDYFVVERHGEIVGCGGFWLNRQDETAFLVWGMVRNHRHLQGIGSYLLLARLQTIGLRAPNTTVLLDTSQHTCEFYRRFGFEVQKTTENYYGRGLHRYDMSLRLDQPRRRWIAEQLGKRER